MPTNNRKIEVHTLRFGDAPWISRCATTLEAWCERHGLELHIWNDELAKEQGYPNAKFCEIDMLESFVLGENDFMLYVDADVLVSPDAPLPDFGPSGFYAATDKWHATHAQEWLEWCDEYFGIRPDDGTTYYNAGVWGCGRDAAKQFLTQAKPPFIERLMEEFQWNWWLYNAILEGMEFHRLDDKWNHSNRIAERPDPTWFLHVWGDDKEEQFSKIV